MGDLTPFKPKRKRPARRGSARRPRWGSPASGPYRARRRVSARDLRLMVWIGLILGLLAYQAMRLPGTEGPPAAPAAIESLNVDPYAESRQSRAILEAQEGAPPRALPSEGGGRGSPAAVRIVDGDTFWHGSDKIRIADIDTPEVRGRCAHERDLAARATRRMEALLAAGPFELERIPGRDEDRYGRKLRVVTRHGQSLGDQLVAEGLARTWSGRREPWC